MLEIIQEKFSRWMLIILWVHIPLIALIAVIIGQYEKLWAAIFVALLLCTGPTLVYKIQGPSALYRALSSSSFMLIIGVLLFVFRGHPWQLDVHMYFFAALAIIASFCDWRAIIVASGVTAVHHLLLNFIIPAWVFPEQSSIIRVLFHAVIVVFETSALTWLIYNLHLSFKKAGEAEGEAKTEAEKAVAMAAKAQTAQNEAEKALSQARAAEETNQALQYKIALEQKEAQQKSGLERRALADQFEKATEQLMHDIKGIVSTLASDVHQLETSAETSQEALKKASSASSEMAHNVETVAAQAEKASDAAQKIALQAETSAATIKKANSCNHEGAETISNLVELTDQIDNVLKMISAIAEQTNLLALNATIEAARAGEAGKGFAVVASEVKALAGQSSKAAEEIAELVASIKQSSAKTVDVNHIITDLIEEISSNIHTIFAAIGEQTAAVGDIADAGHRAHQDTKTTHEAVDGMGYLINKVHTASTSTTKATENLSQKTEALSRELATILQSLRQDSFSIAAE